MSSPTDSGLRVGVIGCGRIGATRAEALPDQDRVVACYDPDPDAARAFAARYGCDFDTSRDALLGRELDVVVVATPHHVLSEHAIAAVESGCHVLVEKPAGMSSAEIERLSAAAERASLQVKVGFNHRFAPGIDRAITDAKSGQFGEVMFARARYGHGGRLGYEREWRMRPELSGGGELVDQGMHLIDLFHWLFGPLPLHSALLRRHFWDAPVEDNAVLVFSEGDSDRSPWALAHVSWTEWKNMFSLEIYCRTAKLHVEGLARSYGEQRLTLYRMRPELGPPDTELFEFSSSDDSWRREWAHFREALLTGQPLRGDLRDAAYAWERIEEIYARTGHTDAS